MGSFAPKGHARLDPAAPRAFAICDDCGFLYNRYMLRAATQWRGNKILPTGFLVCDKCWDMPNPTLRVIKLPPDPVPVREPRSEPVATMGITMDEPRYTMDSTRYTMDIT